MAVTAQEFWTVIHGMGLGALFLLGFAGGLAGLYSMRLGWLTYQGLLDRVRRLNIGTVVMAATAWLTVITGTWVIYPWYRATPPAGTGDDALADFPRAYLLAHPQLADWQTFGMEWKEHVAWLAPMLATAVAYIVVRYGLRLANMPRVRVAVITLFVLAFVAAAVAGAFGAFITKVAPLH